MNKLNLKIIELLNGALKNAYAVYSNFQVACVIEFKNDALGTNYISGYNIENVSYGGTICAERTALITFLNLGHNPKKVQKIYLKATKTDNIVPCGICCQFLLEFLNPETLFLIVDRKNNVLTMKLKEFLPFHFKFKL